MLGESIVMYVLISLYSYLLLIVSFSLRIS